MMTTKKHLDFLVEPMGDKSVTTLPGIGVALRRRLEQQGIDKACVVLGKFLLLKKDSEMFIEWLKDVSGANSCQARACEHCLRDWCDTFV